MILEKKERKMKTWRRGRRRQHYLLVWIIWQLHSNSNKIAYNTKFTAIQWYIDTPRQKPISRMLKWNGETNCVCVCAYFSSHFLQSSSIFLSDALHEYSMENFYFVWIHYNRWGFITNLYRIYFNCKLHHVNVKMTRQCEIYFIACK